MHDETDIVQRTFHRNVTVSFLPFVETVVFKKWNKDFFGLIVGLFVHKKRDETGKPEWINGHHCYLVAICILTDVYERVAGYFVCLFASERKQTQE